MNTDKHATNILCYTKLITRLSTHLLWDWIAKMDKLTRNLQYLKNIVIGVYAFNFRMNYTPKRC